MKQGKRIIGKGILFWAVFFTAVFSIHIISYAGMDLETGGAVGGIAIALNNYYARTMEPDKALAQSVQLVANGTVVVDTSENTAAKKLVDEVQKSRESAISKSAYENIAISRVSDFVNIRTRAASTSDPVGKIYNNSAAVILETVDGEGGKWYKVQSGNVTGYIMAKYFTTGAEAEKIAKEVGTTYGTVDGTATLRLREKADQTSGTLTLLSNGAKYQVLGEEGDFLKVQVDDDLVGYVFKDYVKTNVEFTKAISNADEEAKKAEEESRKAKAAAAAAELEQAKKEAGDTNAGQPVIRNTEVTAKGKKTTTAAVGTRAKTDTAAETVRTKTAAAAEKTAAAGNETVPKKKDTAAETAPETAREKQTVLAQETVKAKKTAAQEEKVAKAPESGKKSGAESSVTSKTRSAIISYAQQFLGNSYVYGGTSLTNGTDCSGFTMRIYEHFGIDIGRTSRDQAAGGKTITESDMKPGDLLFYASGDYINHVSMYIGNGTVIHASSSTTGIIESPANYRTPCKVVSFLN